MIVPELVLTRTCLGIMIVWDDLDSYTSVVTPHHLHHHQDTNNNNLHLNKKYFYLSKFKQCPVTPPPHVSSQFLTIKVIVLKYF